MGKEDVIEISIGWLLMTVIFGLVFSYLLELPLQLAFLYGSVVSAITVIGHELAHLFTAQVVCNIRQSEFVLTTFAIKVSLFSILVLLILMWLKSTFGVKTYFLPLVASPGAIYVENLRIRKCGDNIAIAGPLYNFVVGLIGLVLLFTMTSPPFVLNSSDPALAVLALVTYFSFVLAFINSLPIKIGNLALDGYHALTIDPEDKLSKFLTIFILFISFCITMLTNWWVVVEVVTHA